MPTESPPTRERIPLPTEFADHLAAVSGLETPPETLGDYWSTFAAGAATSDRTLTAADMYTDDPTRHEVRVDGRVRYTPCVLDALGAAVMEAQAPVTVRSVDPVAGTPVTFDVGDDSLDVTPEDAVISFGIAPDVPELESTDESLYDWLLGTEDGTVGDAFCRYINAFESAESYEQWAAETDGVSMQLPPGPAVALMRQLDGGLE